MNLPNLVRIRQNLPDRGLADVAQAVRDEMESADWTRAVKPGSETDMELVAEKVYDPKEAYKKK